MQLSKERSIHLKKYRNLHLNTGKVVNEIEEVDEFDYDADYPSMEEVQNQKSDDNAIILEPENL